MALQQIRRRFRLQSRDSSGPLQDGTGCISPHFAAMCWLLLKETRPVRLGIQVCPCDCPDMTAKISTLAKSVNLTLSCNDAACT